jgi:hypothetical protein
MVNMSKWRGLECFSGLAVPVATTHRIRRDRRASVSPIRQIP